MKPIDYAKQYISFGWSLIPIVPETKMPAIKWKKYQEQKATLLEIEEWLNKGWYLAVVTGDISGILIVDDDRVKNGLGEWGFDSPVIAKTQHNGKHYYYKYDREIHSHSNTELHVDLKAWHSYCLVPPFGGREWIKDPAENLSKLQPISDEIVRLIKSDKKTTVGVKTPLEMIDFINIPEGARTDSLYRIACSVFNRLPKDEGLRVLIGTNETYIPPLERREFEYQTLKAWDFVQLSREKEKQKPVTFKLTDTGNAELITSLYGDRVRFDHRRKRWLIWRGHRWQPDVDGEINRFAIQSARERYLLASKIEDTQKKVNLAKWAISSESKPKLDASIGILKNLVPVADSGDNWDRDNMLLSCPNGILDLRTGVLRDGKPEDRITMVCGVEFDPEAVCPRWERFVNEIFEENIELIHYVHKAVGYSITGAVNEQVAFFGFGFGSNGKSVFFKTISGILGDYAYDAPVSLLQRSSSSSSNSNDVASIEFKRFLVSSETLSTAKLNEQRLKSWTGGDRVTARYLYSEFFTFEPTVKPWLFINHKPSVEDDSYGFWRRVRMIPFNRTFAPHEQDKNLVETLKKEYSGILNWLLKGCLLWCSEGLDPTPEIVNLATQDYRQENDELAEFISDKCIKGEGISKASDLFKAYQKWAEEDQGLKGKDIMSKTAFGRRMTDKFDKVRSNKGFFYKGISVIGVGIQGNFVAECIVDGDSDKTIETSCPKDVLLKTTPDNTPEPETDKNTTPKISTVELAEKIFDVKARDLSENEIEDIEEHKDDLFWAK